MYIYVINLEISASYLCSVLPPQVKNGTLGHKRSGFSKNDMDLQILKMELLFNMMRLLSKLVSGRYHSAMVPGLQKSMTSSTTLLKNRGKSRDTSSWIEDIVKKYTRLPIARAMFLMHKTQIDEITREKAKENLKVYFIQKRSEGYLLGRNRISSKIPFLGTSNNKLLKLRFMRLHRMCLSVSFKKCKQ